MFCLYREQYVILRLTVFFSRRISDTGHPLLEKLHTSRLRVSRKNPG